MNYGQAENIAAGTRRMFAAGENRAGDRPGIWYDRARGKEEGRKATPGNRQDGGASPGEINPGPADRCQCPIVKNQQFGPQNPRDAGRESPGRCGQSKPQSGGSATPGDCRGAETDRTIGHGRCRVARSQTPGECTKDNI